VKVGGSFVYLFELFGASFQTYILLNSIPNLWMAFLVILFEILLHCCYSGIPFKADFHQKRFKHINYILLFWGLGRALKGSLGIIQKDDIETIWKEIIQQDITLSTVLGPILLIIDAFVSEIIPLLLVNDSKVLTHLFIRSENQNPHLISLQAGSSLTDGLLDDSISMEFVISSLCFLMLKTIE